MPMKTCHRCTEKNGPRTLYCKGCGNPFESTLKAFGHDMTNVQANPSASSSQQVVVNNNFTVSTNGTGKVAIRPTLVEDQCGILNLDPGKLFDDLYGKEAAIEIVTRSLSVYNTTGGKSRYHSLVYGGPSCGKSELVGRIELMLGKENVIRMNAESTSKAGMENEILNYPGDLPPCLIIEEIDKCLQDNILWLLPTLDTRQEIIKVTAREGMQRRRVPFICIATCNDIEKLERMFAGSIASRFSNKVFVKDMDDATLYQILEHKIKVLPNWDYRWIKPAVDYCRSIGDASVRKCEAVIMCGQEKLLDGSYQTLLSSSCR